MTDPEFGPGVARLLLLAIEAGIDPVQAYDAWESGIHLFPRTHRLFFTAKTAGVSPEATSVRIALGEDVHEQINAMLTQLAQATRKLGATQRAMPHYCLRFHMPVFTPALMELQNAACHFAGSFGDDVPVSIEMQQLLLLLEVGDGDAAALGAGMRPPLRLRTGSDFREIIGDAMADELTWVLEKEVGPLAFWVGRALCLWPQRGAGLMQASSAFYFSFVE